MVVFADAQLLPGNVVQSNLGPDGLPVYNASYGGPALSDVNSKGELTWWTPSLQVTETGTATVALPYTNTAFFAPNGTGSNNNSLFQTAVVNRIQPRPPFRVQFRLLWALGIALAAGAYPRSA